MKYIRYVIIGLAVAFIVIGILTGELQTILQKAATICLECIGIG